MNERAVTSDPAQRRRHLSCRKKKKGKKGVMNELELDLSLLFL